MKKFKIGDDEVAKIMINKMLEKHGVDYDYVMANQHIDGKVWCSYYDWTQKESDAYQKWWIDFQYTMITPRKSKKMIEKSWPWFNLMYGLRIKKES